MSKMQPIGRLPGEGPVVALLSMLEDPEGVKAKLAEFHAARDQANDAIEAYNSVQDEAEEAADQAEAALEEIAVGWKSLEEAKQDLHAKSVGCDAWEKALDERAAELDLGQKTLAADLEQLKLQNAAVNKRAGRISEMRAELDEQEEALAKREDKVKKVAALLK